MTVGLATAATLAGLGLLLVAPLVPLRASTGAECGFWPATDAFGPGCSAAAVEQASNAVDRESTRSCIDRSRMLAGGALILVDVPAAGLTIAGIRRRRAA
ncbi:hypothetical protein KIH74_14540 [Kineosporia sp. J2-2]|uniref:Uncharacterized protein n=1 Tax=Kineosporia corallincola TaxID=2835133 RepID=A0ABS5TGI5_9ACTN|nr:hypothetical protein [Kineosporia corallincola]MBT0770155.1 hypothetical protein [Kineosporia corallincola]